MKTNTLARLIFGPSLVALGIGLFASNGAAKQAASSDQKKAEMISALRNAEACLYGLEEHSGNIVRVSLDGSKIDVAFDADSLPGYRDGKFVYFKSLTMKIPIYKLGFSTRGKPTPTILEPMLPPGKKLPDLPSKAASDFFGSFDPKTEIKTFELRDSATNQASEWKADYIYTKSIVNYRTKLYRSTLSSIRIYNQGRSLSFPSSSEIVAFCKPEYILVKSGDKVYAQDLSNGAHHQVMVAKTAIVWPRDPDKPLSSRPKFIR